MSIGTTPTIATSTGRESAALKAARILVERRLTVTALHRGRITARCRGDEQTYHLGYNPTGRGWWCHCAEMRGRCSHLLALAAVVDVNQWEGKR